MRSAEGLPRRLGLVAVCAALVLAGIAALASLGGCATLRDIDGIYGAGEDTGLATHGTPSQLQPMDEGASGERFLLSQAEPETAPDESAKSAAPPANVDRLVIRTTTMRVEVDSVDDSIDKIRAAAAKHGGSITAMVVGTDESGPIYRYDQEGVSGPAYDGAPLSGFVTVRVPVAKFAAFSKETLALGKVLRQQETGDDVTQQHVDLEARLGNLKAEEKRLREFFSAAKKVREMLDIERELARVRGEIEAMQAQVDHLERQAAMATITIELVEPKPVVRPQGTDWGVAAAFTRSVRAFVGTMNAMIVLLGAVLPLALVLVAIFIPARILVRRRRVRRLESDGSHEDQVPADDAVDAAEPGEDA